MIAVYLRVSSKDQDEASQRASIEQHLRGQGLDPDSVQWFVDRKTGTNMDRPQMQDLDALVMAGKVTQVFCFKLDRLSRSVRDGINLLYRWLSCGVRLVAVTQNLDFSGPVGKMVASILFAVAEMENETRRERQAAGIAVAKERGVYVGRRPGSLKVKDGMKKAADLRERGLNRAEIARMLGVTWTCVDRYLKVWDQKDPENDLKRGAPQPVGASDDHRDRADQVEE